MDKENKLAIDLIKDACERLLGCNLLPENGWSEDDVNILTKIVKDDFSIEFKGDV